MNVEVGKRFLWGLTKASNPNDHVGAVERSPVICGPIVRTVREDWLERLGRILDLARSSPERDRKRAVVVIEPAAATLRFSRCPTYRARLNRVAQDPPVTVAGDAFLHRFSLLTSFGRWRVGVHAFRFYGSCAEARRISKANPRLTRITHIPDRPSVPRELAGPWTATD